MSKEPKMYKKIFCAYFLLLSSIFFIPIATYAAPTINDADYEAELFATGLGAITGITMDSSGALYATDYLNGRLLKFSSDGTYVELATGFPYAKDVAFTQDGRFFMLSQNTVYQVYSDGTRSVLATGFSYSTSLEAWGNDLYISNSGDGTISKIDSSGNVSTFLSGFSAPFGPYGISFDELGNMYFTDHGTGDVYTSDLLGNVQYLGTIAPLGAIYTLPDNRGNLYVTSSLLASIYKIDELGNMTLFATDFTGKTNPPVIGPTDMLFDDEGNMFVGDGASIWKLSLKTIDVEIDIKPGIYPNRINIKSNGLLPVAVLYTDDFDAGQVDITTVTLGNASAISDTPYMEDIDGDGDYDQIFYFRSRDTGIKCDDTDATLTGKTFAGKPIQGSDSIQTIGCK